MVSVLSPARSALPPLPDLVFRARLEVIRGQLAELERCCPPELGLDVALDVLEVTPTSLGWRRPPLTGHDKAVLAGLGCPGSQVSP
jgi:hypothetical protein